MRVTKTKIIALSFTRPHFSLNKNTRLQTGVFDLREQTYVPIIQGERKKFNE